MEIKKIGCINKQSDIHYIPIPREFGKVGDYVKITIISDKELKLELVKLSKY